MGKFKQPQMQFDKSIDAEEGKKLLTFIEEYIKVFRIPFIERLYEKTIATNFLGKNSFESFQKKRKAFTDREIREPEHYIAKYRKIISRIILLLNCPLTKSHIRNVDVLESLLSFFMSNGYLTPKQINYASILLRDEKDNFNKNYSATLINGLLPGDYAESVLRLHLKSDIDIALKEHKGLATIAELTSKQTENSKKSSKPKEKRFFSLKEIREELLAN